MKIIWKDNYVLKCGNITYRIFPSFNRFLSNIIDSHTEYNISTTPFKNSNNCIILTNSITNDELISGIHEKVRGRGTICKKDFMTIFNQIPEKIYYEES